MPKLFINDNQVEVQAGATILDAAAKLGIEIPTMCHLKDYKASTSCMVCVVNIAGTDKLIPACGAIAEEGMKIETDNPKVIKARSAALELLLSDHLGDCLGPCQTICPAQMDIPLMIRQIAAGKFREALETVKKDIALPAILGRICPAPCENGCRRAVADEAVSICLLKRFVADLDLDSDDPYLPPCAPKIPKRVAIIGAGPAGLSAAYYLLQQGVECTIFDDHHEPGGMLRYGVSEKKLPVDYLDAEIDVIEKLGAYFRYFTRVGEDIKFKELHDKYDAIIIAVGDIDDEQCKELGFCSSTKNITYNKKTYQTLQKKVFVAGGIIRKRKMAVRSVADGKEAAMSVFEFLSGKDVTGVTRPFNCRIGRIAKDRITPFMQNADKSKQLKPEDILYGFTPQQAKAESLRCLHCDCRKPDACKLREYSQEYEANASAYKAPRRAFVQYDQHPEIIFEPGKCIDCGLCIQIAAESKEKLGLTFIARGFEVKVAVPFDASIEKGLEVAARKCAKACPTGAIALKD